MKRISPATGISLLALVVATGGTSYAAAMIGSADIVDDSIKSRDIKNSTLRSLDILDNSIRSMDVRDGTLQAADFADGAIPAGPAGPAGADGPAGPAGPEGPAGVGRWLLVNAAGVIEAQSGGFSIAAAYPTLANTATPPADNSLRANGNVYINANEPLGNNGIIAGIALQNATDQNNDGIMNGRAGADLNFEFAGEVSATLCGVAGVVGCAPANTNNVNHLVVSPRNSDGTVTTDGQRKRFYVIISGDSSDYVAPPA